jgi:hypothetical protein
VISEEQSYGIIEERNEKKELRNKTRNNVGENMESFLFTEYENEATLSA